MANLGLVAQLVEKCEAIENLDRDTDNFIERPEWGAITFEIARHDIETSIWLVKEVKRLSLPMVPDTVAQTTIQHLDDIFKYLKQIDQFQISQGNPGPNRDNISQGLKSSIESAIASIGIWMPLMAFRAGEIENWAAKAKDTNDNVNNILQETKKLAAAGKEDVDKIIQAARAVAGEAGAAEFTDAFRDAAEANVKQSKIWLWPTGVFASFALGISIWLISGYGFEVPVNSWEAVYQLGGRVITIAVLFYAAVWSGRVVLANMHQASVNKHRAVSLQTLQAFHKAAADEAAKDAVVMEAARAVYENVTSGYIVRQASEQGGPARLLEIVRNANKMTPPSSGN